MPPYLNQEPVKDVERLAGNLAHIDDLYHADLLTYLQAWTLFGKIVIVDHKQIYWVPIHDLMFYGFVRDRPVLLNDGGCHTITSVIELEEAWDES